MEKHLANYTGIVPSARSATPPKKCVSQAVVLMLIVLLADTAKSATVVAKCCPAQKVENQRLPVVFANQTKTVSRFTCVEQIRTMSSVARSYVSLVTRFKTRVVCVRQVGHWTMMENPARKIVPHQ